MSEDNSIDRRTFVKLAGGAAASVSLAGCSGDGAETDSPDEGGDTPTPTESGGMDGGDTPTPTESGGGDETSTPEGTDAVEEFPVTITQGQPPSTLDPHDHRETPTDTVVLHAYEGILARSPGGEIFANLATAFERVESGVVRFDIREDVQFHNGDDLTPRDVAYSINRIVDGSVGFESPQSDQLSGVTGASVIDGERAVRVESDGLNPVVFSLFANYCDVMQRSWVRADDTEPATEMNGTGPFQLSSYEEGVQVVFERFDGYWDDPADVTELTFLGASEASTRVNQLLEGETDIVVNVPPQEISRLSDSDSASVAAEASTRIIYNGMRYDVEPFSDPQFRRAMNYAVDLDSIIENVLQTFGDPTGQPTLEGFVGHNPDVEPYEYDPDQAEQLVSESGYEGAELELHTPNGRYLRDFEIAQAVVSQIDSLSNVSCEVNQRDFGALAGELTDGDITTSPHFYLIGWGNATFDASQTIIPLLTSDGSVSSYSNEEVDSMMESAQNEDDREARDQTLQELNALLHDEAPWIFLNRQYSVYGSSNRIDWTPRADERIDAYAISPAE
jgi:peptide/nickel transport system substrate-binding protein